jgi:hypothetical protein
LFGAAVAISLKKIVSGGQTGVDRAALEAAQEQNLNYGGWCPKGLRAEDGRVPEKFRLKETPSESYRQRTAWNVRDSDGTLILSFEKPAGGTALTIQFAREYQKPYFLVFLNRNPRVEETLAWLEKNQIQILNVAGPRGSRFPNIFQHAKRFLNQVFSQILEGS